MQVRGVEIAGLGVGLAVGAALQPAALHGDPARLLTTFLGLVSASVLPSVSLIAATMTPGGRSVSAVNRLKTELDQAIDTLLLLFGLVGLVFATLFTLSLDPPQLLQRLPYLTSEIMPRAGQSIVVGGTALILMRVGYVPAILRRSLHIRHEIAVDDARKKTLENATKAGEPKSYFPLDPAFGKTVTLEEARQKTD